MNEPKAIAKQQHHQVATMPPAASMADQLISMAIDKNLDMDKLERLMKLKSEEEEKTAKAAFNVAMAGVQCQIEPIIADADNDQTDSRYARLSTIVGTLAPIYAAQGFSVSFGTCECASQRLVEMGWFRTTAELSHVAGYSKHYHVDLPADTLGAKGTVNKTVIHGTKSALTYARGILMGLMFNFTTSLDVDEDGNQQGDTITPEQAAVLKDELAALEADVEFFCTWLQKGLQSIDDMPVTLLERARKAINEQKAAQKATRK